MGNVTNRKLAVITGASSGIVRELAQQCAENGLDVLMCAEDTGIHNVASKILDLVGDTAVAVSLFVFGFRKQLTTRQAAAFVMPRR